MRAHHPRTLITLFLTELKAEHKSAATLRSYGHDLRVFVRERTWTDLAAVKAQDVEAFVFGPEGLSPATRMRRRSSLRSFFEWAVDRGYVAANPAERLRGVKLAPERRAAPDNEALERILAVIEDPRDRLVFHLLIETGARIGEVLAIRLENLRLEAGEILVEGTRGHLRTLHLQGTLPLLVSYLREQGWLSLDGRGVTADGLLFPSGTRRGRGQKERALHYTAIQKAWQRYRRQAGLDISICQLRHAYAAKLIAQGTPADALQRLMGYRHLGSAARYASPDPKD